MWTATTSKRSAIGQGRKPEPSDPYSAECVEGVFSEKVFSGGVSAGVASSGSLLFARCVTGRGSNTFLLRSLDKGGPMI